MSSDLFDRSTGGTVALFDRATIDETALWQFLRSLRASGLVPAEYLDAVARQARPGQLDALGERLVADRVLTAYQLGRVRAGKTDDLVLGQYHVLDELGRGGFGQVYKARHALMNRVVALKVIAAGRTRDPVSQDLFVREVAIATRLIHPNIVTAYDADETNGTLFLAMEYVDGPTLDKLVSARGPLSPVLAVAVLRQVARALQFAHAMGVVHRDLKPANLMLAGSAGWLDPETPNDVPPALVKVMDFGLARVLHPSGPGSLGTILCEPGTLVGTLAYMAPEQARNPHDSDICSDLYSLGCTVYHALAGRPPYRGTITEQIVAVLNEDRPEPLAHTRPDVPPALTAVVERLMAKRPAERYQTPSDLLGALDRLAIRRVPPVSAPNPSAPKSSPAPGPVAPVAPLPIDTPQPGADRTAVNLATAAAEVPVWWREWVAVVRALARGASPGIGEGEYKVLFRVLVTGLRAAAGTDEHPNPRYARVFAVVEPWVALQNLIGLDARTRVALYEKCRDLDADLFPPPPPPAVGRWAAAGCLVAAVATGLLAVLSPQTVPAELAAVVPAGGVPLAAGVAAAVSAIVLGGSGGRAR